MLLPTIDTRKSLRMTDFDVDPASLPRPGDYIDMGEHAATWEVKGIAWSENPDTLVLEPKAILLSMVETMGQALEVAARSGS